MWEKYLSGLEHKKRGWQKLSSKKQGRGNSIQIVSKNFSPVVQHPSFEAGRLKGAMYGRLRKIKPTEAMISCQSVRTGIMA